MAKNREPDNLALDMMKCKADGFGCDYGRWKAMQDRPVAIEPKTDELPEGWLICQHCGKPFKPKSRRPQKYCEQGCQRAASYARRDKKRYAEYYRTHMAKKREEERKLRNESCA